MANKIYVAPETQITFVSSGGDVTFTLTSLGSGAGRMSAQKDWGAASHAHRYEWRMKFTLATTGVIGETVDLYIVTSDGTIEDGDVGTADAALSALDSFRNFQYIGSVLIDVADTGPFHGSGEFLTSARYFSVAVWNATADAFHATGTLSAVEITPMPLEVQ